MRTTSRCSSEPEGVWSTVVAGLIAASLAAAFILCAAALSWWTWRPMVKRRAVVQLDDGTAFDGVVMSRRGPLLVLADVTVRVAGNAQRIDGPVVVERTRVVFVQVV